MLGDIGLWISCYVPFGRTNTATLKLEIFHVALSYISKHRSLARTMCPIRMHNHSINEPQELCMLHTTAAV